MTDQRANIALAQQNEADTQKTIIRQILSKPESMVDIETTEVTKDWKNYARLDPIIIGKRSSEYENSIERHQSIRTPKKWHFCTQDIYLETRILINLI